MANAFLGKVMGGILGCAMAVAAADAQTLAQSRARLQNLSYEIYDAVPSDGIAAQARFLDEANAWRTQLYFEAYHDDDDQSPYSHYSNDDYESVVSKASMRLTSSGGVSDKRFSLGFKGTIPDPSQLQGDTQPYYTWRGL